MHPVFFVYFRPISGILVYVPILPDVYYYCFGYVCAFKSIFSIFYMLDIFLKNIISLEMKFAVKKKILNTIYT